MASEVDFSPWWMAERRGGQALLDCAMIKRLNNEHRTCLAEGCTAPANVPGEWKCTVHAYQPPKAEPWTPTSSELEAARAGAKERGAETLRIAAEAFANLRQQIADGAPPNATHWRYVDDMRAEYDAHTHLARMRHRVTYATLPEGHGVTGWMFLVAKEGA